MYMAMWGALFAWPAPNARDPARDQRMCRGDRRGGRHHSLRPPPTDGRRAHRRASLVSAVVEQQGADNLLDGGEVALLSRHESESRDRPEAPDGGLGTRF